MTEARIQRTTRKKVPKPSGRVARFKISGQGEGSNVRKSWCIPHRNHARIDKPFPIEWLVTAAMSLGFRGDVLMEEIRHHPVYLKCEELRQCQDLRWCKTSSIHRMGVIHSRTAIAATYLEKPTRMLAG